MNADMPCDAPSREEENRRQAASDELHAWLQRLSWEGVLAANLTTAAALCASWRHGISFQDELFSIIDPIPFDFAPSLLHEKSWHPGCGRTAPGWGET